MVKMPYERYDRIHIDAPPQVVFDVVNDVRIWPEIFPPCQKLEVLEESGRHRRIQIHARQRKVDASWRSVQRIDPDLLRIDFQQEPGSGPFALMQGWWEARPAVDGCELVLFHRFTMKAPLLRNPLGHLIVGQMFVGKSSMVELQAVKTRAEEQGV
jgi:ribosome-associated toxin RatA of RatAB toxin-antitoxin module